MNIKINNIEQHSATVVLTNIDTTYNDRTLHFYLNGTLKNEFTIQDGTTKITFNLTLDNAGAEYTVYIELWGWVSLLGDQLLDWVEDSFITKSEESEPEEPEPEEYWPSAWADGYIWSMLSTIMQEIGRAARIIPSLSFTAVRILTGRTLCPFLQCLRRSWLWQTPRLTCLIPNRTETVRR